MIAPAMLSFLAAISFDAATAMNERSNPAILRHGLIVPVPGAAIRADPELNYRVAFSVTKAATRSDQINPGLEKVARYVNLLRAEGVPSRRVSIVVAVHGAATGSLLTNEAHIRKHGGPNPNVELVTGLREAGVSVHVCGQALAGQKIERTSILPGVLVDLSALVTLTTLQLKGWALVTD